MPIMLLPPEINKLTINGLKLERLEVCNTDIYESHGAEDVIVYGWHESGVVLNALRKASENHLVNWVEELISVDLSITDLKIGDVDSYDDLKNGIVKITILRHKEWDKNAKIKSFCARFKDWYAGSREDVVEEPSLDWIDDEPEYFFELGFCISGDDADGNEHFLEWPTHDYDFALKAFNKWSSSSDYTNVGLEFQDRLLAYTDNPIPYVLDKAIRANLHKLESDDVFFINDIFFEYCDE
ncbi:MAG: hypothetical protein QM500_21305 [Methylococcales bacterium]